LVSKGFNFKSFETKGVIVDEYLNRLNIPHEVKPNFVFQKAVNPKKPVGRIYSVVEDVM